MNATVLINGDVWTMDPRTPPSSAICLQGNRVASVGDDAAALAEGKRHGAPEVVDLKGKTVLPGLIDAHLHMAWKARMLRQVDCSSPKSIPEIVEMLKRQRVDSTGWLQGYGYDDNKLEERRHPTRQELDRASSDVPIVLCNASLHMLVVNTKALEVLGVGENTPDPTSGRIVRDPAGRPTGLFLEGAQTLVLQRIPSYSLEELAEGLAQASASFSAHGLTSVGDMGVGELGPVELQAYEKAHGERTLRVRANLYHPFTNLEDLTKVLDDPESAFCRMSRIESDWLRFRGIKLFLDGSLIGRTAAARVPYTNTGGDCGYLVMEPEQLERMVRYSQERGFQVAVHAIGEAAVDTCAEVYEKISQDRPRADRRHRIEHCGLVNEQSLKRMRRAGVVVASQPIFLNEFGDGFKRCLESGELRKVYAYQSLLRHGVTLAFSSDTPVSRFDPLHGIQAAVTRSTESGDLFEGQERVTLEAAVRCYTVNGAYASFEEQKKGRLAPSYLADAVVLSGPLTAETVGEVRVERTYLDGRLVYAR
jgi:predicted amidohydrolase YtcJ